MTEIRTAISCDGFVDGSCAADYCQEGGIDGASVSRTQEGRHNAVHVFQSRGRPVLQACAVGLQARQTRMDQGTAGNSWLLPSYKFQR